jgi:D-3-phosphoglycerate dehydrogenase
VWVTVYTEGCLTREQLLKEVEKADILWVGLNHQINADVLARAKHLKVIVSPTTGLDHIDVGTASSRNVDILSLNGETEFLQTVWATAEHTVALMLCIMRRVHAANRHTVSGGWKRDDYVGEELHGKTVGIVGYGRIGNMVRKLLSPFGVTILVKDRGRQGGDTRLNDLLAASHVVTLHTAEQEFGVRQFSRMRWGSYFINTARGFKVDEQALVRFLESGQLAGAALDVVCDEIARRQHPAFKHRGLLQEYAHEHPRKLILTPHIGGYTYDSAKKVEAFMREKLKTYLDERRP